MKRKASAVWTGGLLDGKGMMSTDTGILSNFPYSVGTRFGDEKGTNPEELIAAAHAGCYSMALSNELGIVGMTAKSIETNATLTIEKVEEGWTTMEIHLDVTAKIPGGNQAKFEEAANKAVKGCPVSRLLNAKITLNAKLVG